MATFTYEPNYNARRTSAPKILEARFGDGYSQRAGDGINTNPGVWDLQWDARDEDEADDIDDFLTARAGYEAFYWAAPGATGWGRYICKEWTRAKTGPGRYALTATFEQVFDQITPTTLSIANISVDEESGTATLTVTKAGGDAPCTVDYATADGTAAAGVDYTSASGTLEFAEGETTQQIAVTIINRPGDNTSRDFTVTLSDAVGATISDDEATVTIYDDTPDAFTFTDQTDVNFSSTMTSAPITVAGISTSVAITVSGGEYNINGGAYTSSAGTVVNGDTVRARHTSSASGLTATNTVVTIGGVADTFTSTTRYKTSAVDYDGATDFAARGADLTGIVDGKQAIYSGWLRLDGGNGSNMEIFALRNGAGATFFQVLRQASNVFLCNGTNSGGAAIVQFGTAGTYTSGVTWLHILLSFDLATPGARHLYVTDVSDLSVTTFTNDTVDFTNGNAAMGALSDGSLKLNGCLAEQFFHTSYLDLSVEANRRKFISAAGKPVYLGANGSTPLGVQPLLYAPTGDPSNNLGTGGTFTVTGTLDAASTSPSDN